MAVADVYQGDIHFRLQNNQNVYSFIYSIFSEDNEGVAARDIAVHMTDVVAPLLIPLHQADVFFQCGTGREIYPGTSLQETQAIDLPGTQSLVQGTTPGQCSLVTQLFGNADNPTARNRGRDFWCGMDQDGHNNGTFFPPILDAYQLFYETLPKTFVSANSNEFLWGIFSRAAADATPQEAFFIPIELIRLNTLVRTQRRRQPEDPCKPFQTFDPNI